MKILVDTHMLVWLAAATARLPLAAREIIEDPDNEIFFSSASIWELTIKHSLGKGEIPVHPRVLHTALAAHDFQEIAITSLHGLAAGSLPPIHKDPFDRIMIAQSIAEDCILITSDRMLARYDAPVRLLL
jgi:PIN domain nuclease of toxin-antitoxin system